MYLQLININNSLKLNTHAVAILYPLHLTCLLAFTRLQSGSVRFLPQVFPFFCRVNPRKIILRVPLLDIYSVMIWSECKSIPLLTYSYVHPFVFCLHNNVMFNFSLFLRRSMLFWTGCKAPSAVLGPYDVMHTFIRLVNHVPNTVFLG